MSDDTHRRIDERFCYPGDIDLLIIPYENDELQMHRTVAVEIKIVRASFLKQGKSPNELGISQATGLLSMGFPYAALAYLIVSDESPREVWRECLVAKVIDDEGRVDLLGNEAADLMPADLIDRSYGRLMKQAYYSNLGLVSAYLGATDDALMGLGRSRSTWLPSCREASPNPKTSRLLLESIVKFFERRPSCFLDNPRFDPV